jgi:hypothetical protein
MRLLLILFLPLFIAGCSHRKIAADELPASGDTISFSNDTTIATIDLPIDPAQAKLQIEQNKKALPEVTGDFDAFKKFTMHLEPHNWYTITTMKDYLNVFLTKANEQDRDSSYFYFVSSYYTVINDQSRSLYTHYPATMRRLDEGETTPETQQFKEFLDLFGTGLLVTEGDFYLDARTDYFLTIFNNRVSPGLNTYLVLRKQEMDEGFSEDAGLLISFEEVYGRVLRWEKFIETYPDGVITGHAKYYLASYLSTLLSGMDNSPVFDEHERLDFEIQKLYEKIIREGPPATSTQIIKGYYDLLSKNEFKRSPDLDSYLDQQSLTSMQGVQPDLR